VKSRRRTSRPNPRRRRRPVGVSRVRAAAIARARVARAMIECEVSDRLPAWYHPGYGVRPLPENCWYVHCGPRLAQRTTGGAAVIVCISKRSGRVLLTTTIQGE
jgi:hypothetical protein